MSNQPTPPKGAAAAATTSGAETPAPPPVAAPAVKATLKLLREGQEHGKYVRVVSKLNPTPINQSAGGVGLVSEGPVVKALTDLTEEHFRSLLSDPYLDVTILDEEA